MMSVERPGAQGAGGGRRRAASLGPGPDGRPRARGVCLATSATTARNEVAGVADVVDRAREDMRRQHDRHRNCSKAEEEFWEHKRAWTPFHRPTMTRVGNAAV